MRPMMAHTYEDKRWDPRGVLVQPKLNGIRCCYRPDTALFQSLDRKGGQGKYWMQRVVEHLQDEMWELSSSFVSKFGIRVSFDGELYRHGWKLQRINGAIAVKRIAPNEDTQEVKFHVYDIQHPTWTQDVRVHRLADAFERTLRGFRHIELVPTIGVSTKAELQRAFKGILKQGYEGLMIRKRNGLYTETRSWDLLKYKPWHDAEFECVGTEDGKGKHQGRLGALTCRTKKGELFNVGTGFSDEEREKFHRYAPIGMPITVKYQLLTERGVPFHPSFVAVRED